MPAFKVLAWLVFAVAANLWWMDKTEVPEVGEVERRILQRLVALGGDRELERSLTLLLADHPEHFVEDFGALLRVIVTGTPEEAEKASNAARLALFHAERGVHDAAWPDYVAAIESGRADPDLIRMVGRFDQDPLPLLQGQLTLTPTDHFAWAALKAICSVDPRWWPALIPFFHEAALGYLPRAGDTKMNTMEIHHAVRALAFMDRRDLAADVVSRIDWPQVAQMRKWARNPPALADYRQRTSELPDLPTGC